MLWHSPYLVIFTQSAIFWNLVLSSLVEFIANHCISPTMNPCLHHLWQTARVCLALVRQTDCTFILAFFNRVIFFFNVLKRFQRWPKKSQWLALWQNPHIHCNVRPSKCQPSTGKCVCRATDTGKENRIMQLLRLSTLNLIIVTIKTN